MALKVKAKEKKLKFSKDGPEVYRYVMVPDLYSTLDQDKVIKEAAIRGSEIELTEDNGVYTGSFAMPGQASTLIINTGEGEDDDYDPNA